MNEMIYTYDGSFEGFLCCIFDSYANKEVLTAITDDEDSAPILFPVRAIQTDSRSRRAGPAKAAQALPLRGGTGAPGISHLHGGPVRFACTGWW